MARIFCYNRVSTEEQKDALAQQRSTTSSFADYICSRYPEITERVPHMDDMFSAYKTEFRNRPYGKIICDAMQKGDHLCCSRLDRMFRNARDFANQMKDWEDKGIIVHFCDLGISSNTSAGKMLATIMVAVAENFSASLSERMKLANIQKYVREGKFPPLHKTWINKLDRGELGLADLGVMNRKAISYIRFVIWRRRYSFLKQGYADSWDKCCDDLERARVAHGDLPAYRPDGFRGEWQKVNVQSMCARIRKTNLPAISKAWSCLSIQQGLDPHGLTRTADYRRPGKNKTSLHNYATGKKFVSTRPPKRWANLFTCCAQCNTTDWPHRSGGLCQSCYTAVHRARRQAAATPQ